jgi:hypothetical protein
MKLRNAVLAAAIGLATLASSPGLLQAQEHWQGGPSEYQRDFERQAFYEGMEGAHKDFQNHRRPDVNNRDEYRHPHVPGEEREPYRDAFRRGYETGVGQIYNEGPR